MDSTEISNNVAAVIDNEDFAMVDATTDLVSTWLAASIYVTTFINPQYHLLQRDTININIDDHFFYVNITEALHQKLLAFLKQMMEKFS